MLSTQSQALTPEQMKQFQRDGYLVLRGVFSADEIDRLRDTFMAQAQNGPVEGLSEIRRNSAPNGYDKSDPLAYYPRMMHPHRHPDKPVGPLVTNYMLDERLHGPLREMMADEPLAVQSMFYFKPPGARGQDLHQDNFYLKVKPGTCLAAWIAVDDADEGNGGMLVVPGTNDLDIKCPEKSDPMKFFTTEHVEPPPGHKPEALILKAGDVLFFNGSVIHGSHPNTSKDRFRRALICHYVPEHSVELSQWYINPTRFDGTVVNIAQATGGGPCGTVEEVVIAAPH